MPIKSKAQRRKFAELLVKGEISEEVFERWNRGAGSKELPERLHPAKDERQKPKKKPATKRKTTLRKKSATKRKTTARKTTARKKNGRSPRGR